MRTSNSAAAPRTFSTTMMVPIITTAMATTIPPRSLPTRSSSFCSGVLSVVASCSIPAMRPISVRIPVATTTAFPRPYVAAVPLHTMLWRSPSPASFSIAAVSLATGRLSPVSALSAVCRAVDWTIRASAGMVSPSSMMMTSPGTISAAGTCRRWPSRTTWACAADIFRSAATAEAARPSWTNPRTAFSITTAKMASAS
jgi:hypothetical protein